MGSGPPAGKIYRRAKKYPEGRGRANELEILVQGELHYLHFLLESLHCSLCVN
jgi:hypothetical protein